MDCLDRSRRHDNSSPLSSKTNNTRNGCSRRPKGELNPPNHPIKQLRAFPSSSRQEFDLEAGYPSMIETEVMLLATGGTMEDASSVSYEGFQCVRFPSLMSDGTETDGSFRTAPLIPAIASTSIGTGNFSTSSDQDFLSCREGSDQCSTGSLFADARSFESAQRDSDCDSFYTCRRFNDQGLRSVLAVPTNVNTEQAFNIPLHVFAQSIEEEAHRKETEEFRNKLIWRPAKALFFFAVFAAGIASITILSRRKETSQGNIGANSPTTLLADSIVSPIPSVAPSISAWAPESEGLAPSIAPMVNGNQWTVSPTLFVFITGNFEEIDDIP